MVNENISHKTNTASNRNIFSRNQTLRDNGDQYCTGVYRNKNNEIAACDLSYNVQKDMDGFLGREIKKQMGLGDTAPDDTVSGFNGLEDILADAIFDPTSSNAAAQSSGIVTRITTAIDSGLDDYEKDKRQASLNDYPEFCRERMSKEKYIKYFNHNCEINGSPIEMCITKSPSNDDSKSRTCHLNNTEDICNSSPDCEWKGGDRLLPEDLKDIMGEDIRQCGTDADPLDDTHNYGLYNCNSLPDNFNNIEYVNSAKVSDFCSSFKGGIIDQNYEAACVSNFEEAMNGTPNWDSSVSTKDECLLKYSDGFWCSHCTYKSSPKPENYGLNTVNNLFDYSINGHKNLNPGEGCTFHTGGISEDAKHILDLMEQQSFRSCVEDQLICYAKSDLDLIDRTGHSTTYIGGHKVMSGDFEDSAAADFDDVADVVVGSAGTAATGGAAPVAFLAEYVPKSFQDCARGNANPNDPEPSKNNCICTNGKYRSKSGAYCQEDNPQNDEADYIEDFKKQISNDVSCSEGASDAASAASIGSMFVPIPGVDILGSLFFNAEANSIGQCQKETKEIINEHGVCPNGFRNCPNYNTSSEGITTFKTCDDLEGDLGEREDLSSLCTECTEIHNVKGLSPADRGRDTVLGSDPSLIDTFSIPGVGTDWTDDDNLNRLDTYNQYFCLDDKATRVIRPPPKSTLHALKNIMIVNENDKQGSLSALYDQATGMLTNLGNKFLGQNNMGNLKNDLCDAGHLLGDIGDDAVNMGDGQGNIRNYCGLPRSNFNDINPCKEGYTIAGPMHLNPFSNYQTNPCMYKKTKEDCESDSTRMGYLRGSDPDIDCSNNSEDERCRNSNIRETMGSEDKFGFELSDSYNNICKWTEPNEENGISSPGRCDLKEKIFQSNYCCRSIPGSEECPFTPIDSWTKFNFSLFRDKDEYFFDNNMRNLNYSMIQTNESCSYKGSPMSNVYCNYDGGNNGVNAKLDIEKKNNLIKPTNSNELNYDDYNTRFIYDDWGQVEDNPNDNYGFKNPSIEPFNALNSENAEEYRKKYDLKFCRTTKSASNSNKLLSEEINDYSDSRFYCPVFNPPTGVKDNNGVPKPYFISTLPCLDPKNWTILKKCSDDNCEKTEEFSFIYDNFEKDGSDCPSSIGPEEKYKQKLIEIGMLDEKNQDLINFISLNNAHSMVSPSPEDPNYEKQKECFIDGVPNPKKDCYFLYRNDINSEPQGVPNSNNQIKAVENISKIMDEKQYISDIYKTWQELPYFPPNKLSYGICDLKTYFNMFDDNQKFHSSEGDGDLCCPDENECKPNTIEKQCLTDNNTTLYKLLIEPQLISDHLNKGDYDNKIKYNYMIDKEEDCPTQYARWHDGSNDLPRGCYQIHKKINSNDGTAEDYDENNCGGDNYGGIWDTNLKGCMQLNLTKSDCLLSNGNWYPTIPKNSNGDDPPIQQTNDTCENKGNSDQSIYLIVGIILVIIYTILIRLFSPSFIAYLIGPIVFGIFILYKYNNSSPIGEYFYKLFKKYDSGSRIVNIKLLFAKALSMPDMVTDCMAASNHFPTPMPQIDIFANSIFSYIFAGSIFTVIFFIMYQLINLSSNKEIKKENIFELFTDDMDLYQSKKLDYWKRKFENISITPGGKLYLKNVREIMVIYLIFFLIFCHIFTYLSNKYSFSMIDWFSNHIVGYYVKQWDQFCKLSEDLLCPEGLEKKNDLLSIMKTTKAKDSDTNSDSNNGSEDDTGSGDDNGSGSDNGSGDDTDNDALISGAELLGVSLLGLTLVVLLIMMREKHSTTIEDIAIDGEKL